LKFQRARWMMGAMLTLILTGLLRGVRTQHALVLENLELRHQLSVLQRTAPHRDSERRCPSGPQAHRLPMGPDREEAMKGANPRANCDSVSASWGRDRNRSPPAGWQCTTVGWTSRGR
jgi:hypothetical protein